MASRKNTHATLSTGGKRKCLSKKPAFRNPSALTAKPSGVKQLETLLMSLLAFIFHINIIEEHLLLPLSSAINRKNQLFYRISGLVRLLPPLLQPRPPQSSAFASRHRQISSSFCSLSFFSHLHGPNPHRLLFPYTSTLHTFSLDEKPLENSTGRFLRMQPGFVSSYVVNQLTATGVASA